MLKFAGSCVSCPVKIEIFQKMFMATRVAVHKGISLREHTCQTVHSLEDFSPVKGARDQAHLHLWRTSKQIRVGQIDPKINSIDTKVSIGSILAWWDQYFCCSFSSINSANHTYFFTEFVRAQCLSQSSSTALLFPSLNPFAQVHCNTKIYTYI